MKIKELLETIEQGKLRYSDFLEWNVAVENFNDPEQDCNCKSDILYSHDECCGFSWKFVKSHSMGCCTYFIKEKVLGIQVHY